MLTNFHTHHCFCRHAGGHVEDYVTQAIEHHYDILGISDHAPIEKYYTDRMTSHEFSIYLDEIKACQKKYQDKLTIYSGLEIEYFSDLHEVYQMFNTKLDYLALACHDYFYQGRKYCGFFIENEHMLKGYFDTLIKAIQTGYFKFAAHPDLFAFTYPFTKTAIEYTHALGEVCKEKDFILEFNANGFRRGKSHINGEYRHPYPYQPFWDIIKTYGVKTIVNSDCHDPKQLNDDADRYARLTARNWGLNVVETIF